LFRVAGGVTAAITGSLGIMATRTPSKPRKATAATPATKTAKPSAKTTGAKSSQGARPAKSGKANQADQPPPPRNPRSRSARNAGPLEKGIGRLTASGRRAAGRGAERAGAAGRALHPDHRRDGAGFALIALGIVMAAALWHGFPGILPRTIVSVVAGGAGGSGRSRRCWSSAWR
jgi:S-DNA-T family DNA segregation ATPase FtsK/SpoIIIE